MGTNRESTEQEKAYEAYDRKAVEKDIDPPPFFRNWGRLYGFVIGFFVLLVVLFYLFTKWFE